MILRLGCAGAQNPGVAIFIVAGGLVISAFNFSSVDLGLGLDGSPVALNRPGLSVFKACLVFLVFAFSSSCWLCLAVGMVLEEWRTFAVLRHWSTQ